MVGIKARLEMKMEQKKERDVSIEYKQRKKQIMYRPFHQQIFNQISIFFHKTTAKLYVSTYISTKLLK